MATGTKSIVDYVTSERFISDGLLQKSASVLELAVEQYDEGLRSSFALLWPRHTIKDDKGLRIDDVLIFPMPEGTDADRWVQRHLRAAIERVGAYAYLNVMRTDALMVGHFESPHVRQTWTYRARREGDVTLLSDPTIVDFCVNNLIPMRGVDGAQR